MNESPPPSSHWGLGLLLVSLLIGSLVVAAVSTLQVFQLRRENQAMRFAQLENRLDLAVRLQLASAIPLVPAKGDK